MLYQVDPVVHIGHHRNRRIVFKQHLATDWRNPRTRNSALRFSIPSIISQCFSKGKGDFRIKRRRVAHLRKGKENSDFFENLYSKEGGKADVLLGYDSPVTMWLNGEMVFCGEKKSACAVPLSLELKPGNNCLILRQVARIPRPYSGGEFGYQLRLVSSPEIYAIK